MTIQLDHKEQDTNSPPPNGMRLESIFGMIPHVTSAPTWIPRTFSESFANYKSGSTYRLYVYNFVGKVWKFVALT